MRVRTIVSTLAVMATVAGPSYAQVRGAARERAKPKMDQKQQALYDWANHMGMLRGVNEADSIGTLELKASGTITVGGQPCKLTDYRMSVDYQHSAYRVNYTCTKPDGSTLKTGEVVGGKYAWDEDGSVGAGLVPGQGRAIPRPETSNERTIRLWASPQGAVKAAVKGGDQTKVAVEGGKTVVTYPIPDVPGAVATATLSSGSPTGLCTRFCAERVEVKQGDTVTEFLYSNYADYNPADNKLDAFYAGHVTEKKNGATLRDLTTTVTQTANLYIVVPVPDSIKNAATPQSTGR